MTTLFKCSIECENYANVKFIRTKKLSNKVLVKEASNWHENLQFSTKLLQTALCCIKNTLQYIDKRKKT